MVVFIAGVCVHKHEDILPATANLNFESHAQCLWFYQFWKSVYTNIGLLLYCLYFEINAYMYTFIFQVGYPNQWYALPHSPMAWWGVVGSLTYPNGTSPRAQTCVPSPYISLTNIPSCTVCDREIWVLVEFTINFPNTFNTMEDNLSGSWQSQLGIPVYSLGKSDSNGKSLSFLQHLPQVAIKGGAYHWEVHKHLKSIPTLACLHKNLFGVHIANPAGKVV